MKGKKKKERIVKKKKIKRKQAIKGNKYNYNDTYQKVSDNQQAWMSKFANMLNPLESRMMNMEAINMTRHLQEDMRQKEKLHQYTEKALSKLESEMKQEKEKNDEQEEELYIVGKNSRIMIDDLVDRINRLEKNKDDSTRSNLDSPTATATAEEAKEASNEIEPLAVAAAAGSQTPFKPTKLTPKEKSENIPLKFDLNTRSALHLPETRQGNLDSFLNRSISEAKADMNKYEFADQWALTHHLWDGKKRDIDFAEAWKKLGIKEDMPKRIYKRKEIILKYIQ